jgi:hypothetical protein
MSDTDDSVIDQLQAKRSRPRRQPPVRRLPTAAPIPPAIATATLKIDERSAEFGPTETPTPPKHADSRDLLAAGGPSVEAGTLPSTDSPSGRKRSSDCGRTATGRDQTGRAALRLEPDEPTANYAVRVRRSLDDLVAWRLAELRRQGARASKVELTEMLRWELADAESDDIVARLERFRGYAPR